MSDRYARHALIEGWDQERLKAAHVVIAGIGALGSETARLLAQAGVGRLLLCDPDTVEESNLSRGALFAHVDIDKPKVTAVRRALGELCPDTEVTTRQVALGCGVGIAELRDATLVISCLDSRGARVELARRCGLVGAALLDGGTQPWGGEVRFYRPGGACFGCGLSHADRAQRTGGISCVQEQPGEPAGASAAVSALIASWLTVDALRLIFGLPMRGGILRVDAAFGDTHRMRLERDPHCPLHERIPQGQVARSPLTWEATTSELRAALGPDEAALAWSEFPDPDRGFGIWLSEARGGARLRDLGVAPREIIRVVNRNGGGPDRFIELAGAPAGGGHP